MSCLSKIRHAYSGLNHNQKKIADFILDKPFDVIQMSIQELAIQTGSSPSTIVRFAKKVCYDGYPKLKLELALEVNNKKPELLDDSLNLDGSFYELIQQENNAYINSINKTFELINHKTLEQVVDGILAANKVFITGMGHEAMLCNDLMLKLNRININAIHFYDAHSQLIYSAHIGQNDIVIAINYSGKTKEIIDIVRLTKKNGAKIITITHNADSELCQFSDYFLPIPVERNLIRALSLSSRNGSTIMAELVYLGVVKKTYHESHKYLTETQEFLLTAIE